MGGLAAGPGRGGALLLATLAWLVAALAAAGPASAHAVLIASEPAAGAELAEPPGQVLLRFSEPVEVPPEAIRVFAGDAARVDQGDAEHGADRSQVRAGLAGDLADGVYTVTWRAVSTDDHPVRGSFTFTVGDPGGAGAVAVDDLPGDGGDAPWSVAAVLAGWLTYGGVLLASGGAAFLVLVHDRREDELRALSRVLTLGAVVAVAASLVALVPQTVLAAGLGWRSLVTPEALAGTAASGVSLAALVRVAGLALLLAGLGRLWAPPAAALALGGGLLALTSFLLAGHTATSEPRALVLASNLVHTATGAVWFGGLVLLGLVLRWRAAGAGGGADAAAGARLVRRFSSVALATLVALAAAGGALAWVEVRSLGALVTTTYGWTLLAKIALVAAVVGVAAYNRRALVGAVARSGDAWRRLSATVRFEAVAIAAVLGVTALLVTLVPARTAAGIGEVFVDYVPLGDSHQVNVVVDPARTGQNEIHLYLLDEAGQLADVGEDVTLRLSQAQAGVAPAEVEPFAAGPGHWLHVGRELSLPGRWRIEVVVLVSEFERLTATTEVDIGGRAR